MAERFSYGSLGAEQTEAVIKAYEETRSCERASLQEGIYTSSATVSRVVREAVSEGFLDPAIKRGPGRPMVNQGHIEVLLVSHPEATDRELASLAGVSQFTVARVRRRMG